MTSAAAERVETTATTSNPTPRTERDERGTQGLTPPSKDEFAGDLDAIFAAGPAGFQPIVPAESDLAALLYTSGTTADPKYNIIVEGPLAADVAESVQSSWKLPLPKEIFTLQRVTMQEADFSGRIPGDIDIPSEFGAVQVLTFDLDGSAPSVEGLPEWVPETREIVNLHVFAEETNRWNTRSVLRHPTEEFQNLLRLTQVGKKTDLDFDYTPGEIPLVEPSTHVPEGLRRRELVCLAANGLLNKDDPEAMAVGSNVDTGGTMGHPCVSIVVKGGGVAT